MCLWELLTCRRLFQREDPTQTGRAVLGDPVPTPSSVADFVPVVFDVIAMKALERDPSKRYQTTREFGRALRDALAHSGEVVDQPLVGEWLEELFPGDRARRQALVAAVRRSGPDAPLESVPAELKIKASSTGTGSRSYRSGSSPGRKTVSEGSNPGGRTISERAPAITEPVPAIDPERDRGTAVKVELSLEPRPRPSRLPLLAGGAAVVGLLLAGTIFFLTRPPEPPRPPPPVDPPAVKTTVVPPTPPPPLPALVVEDAGPPGVLDAGEAVIDAGAAPPEDVADAGLEHDAGVSAPPPPIAVAPKPKPKPPPVVAPPPPIAVQPKPPPPADTSVKGKGDGRVRFKTPGATAEVLVDGKPMGTTPLTLDLPAGQHTFELRARGFDFGGPQQLKVSVGGDYNVEIDMR